MYIFERDFFFFFFVYNLAAKIFYTNLSSTVSQLKIFHEDF